MQIDAKRVVRSGWERTSVRQRVLMVATGRDSYQSEDGSLVMQRETGRTPNGNTIGNRWVLGGSSGAFLDVDQHRDDLLERHSLKN